MWGKTRHHLQAFQPTDHQRKSKRTIRLESSWEKVLTRWFESPGRRQITKTMLLKCMIRVNSQMNIEGLVSAEKLCSCRRWNTKTSWSLKKLLKPKTMCLWSWRRLKVRVYMIIWSVKELVKKICSITRPFQRKKLRDYWGRYYAHLTTSTRRVYPTET